MRHTHTHARSTVLEHTARTRTHMHQPELSWLPRHLFKICHGGTSALDCRWGLQLGFRSRLSLGPPALPRVSTHSTLSHLLRWLVFVFFRSFFCNNLLRYSSARTRASVPQDRGSSRHAPYRIPCSREHMHDNHDTTHVHMLIDSHKYAVLQEPHIHTAASRSRHLSWPPVCQTWRRPHPQARPCASSSTSRPPFTRTTP